MIIKKLTIGLTVVALVFGVMTMSASALSQSDVELLAIALNLNASQQALLMSMVDTGPSMAAGYTFTTDLTIGSTGPDVVALQSTLESKGFLAMPVGVAKGYFGPLTKAAVSAWQQSEGITPAAGYFGPISRAAMNSMVVVTPPPVVPPTEPLCPNGNTLASNCATPPVSAPTEPLCPNGNTIASNCATPPGVTPPPIVGGPSDGVLVSGTIALESTPSDGTDVKKGDTNAAIAKWKIKTSGSDGVLKQFGIQTTNRSWLYWNAARLVDGSGNVIAEKTNLSSADFSEVTAGTDYRLIFGNLTHLLPKGTDNFVTLQISSPANNDKAAVNGLVVSQLSNSIVIADANDSYTYSDGDTADRTWDFIAATAGNIVPTLAASAPQSRWIKVSSSGTTPNIVLAALDLKAENRAAKIEKLTFTINTAGSADGKTVNADGANAPSATTLFNSIDLYELGGTSAISSGSVGSSTTFTNLNINIPVGTTKTFELRAVLADSDNYTLGVGASTTILATTAGISGVDSNFDSLTVSGSTVTSNATRVSTTIANLSGLTTSVVKQPDKPAEAEVKFIFAVTADGGNVNISKTPNTALATSSTFTTGIGTSTATVVDATNTNPGDTSTYWVVSPGSPRTFTYTGQMNNTDTGTPDQTSAGVKEFKVTKVYWDDDTTGFQEFVTDFNIEALKASVLLSI